MPKEIASVHDLAKIITDLSEHQVELRKIQSLSSRFEDDLSDMLDVYADNAGRKWNKISDTISRMSKKDQAKLKVLRPHLNYLSKYKLLTLTNRTPKPGDPFIDLVVDHGPAFVWSPKNPEKFRAWRKDATDNRSLEYADSGALFMNGKIEDLRGLDPNIYLVAAAFALQK